jgi:hypothetical protein
MSGTRANCPATMRDARSVRASIILGIMDLVLLAIVFVWLIFLCGGGSWPAGAPDTNLTLLHLAHLTLAVPALLLFSLSVLFLPIWFAVLGLIVLFIDVFVLVGRFNIIAAGGFSVFCTLFMLLFDGIFFLLAASYLGFAVSAISRFGLFGDGYAVRTPYTFPRVEGASLAKAQPQTTSLGGATAANQGSGGVPSVYLHASSSAAADQKRTSLLSAGKVSF